MCWLRRGTDRGGGGSRWHRILRVFSVLALDTILGKALDLPLALCVTLCSSLHPSVPQHPPYSWG